VLACRDFPTCQGAWWPPMDFAAGFSLRRELGLHADGSFLPFAALTAIHQAHRLGAVVVLIALALLAWRMRRSAAPQVRRCAWPLLAVGGWQLATGLSNAVLGRAPPRRHVGERRFVESRVLPPCPKPCSVPVRACRSSRAWRSTTH
jgi:heme A synthase